MFVHKACVVTILGVTNVGTPGKHMSFYVIEFSFIYRGTLRCAQI